MANPSDLKFDFIREVPPYNLGKLGKEQATAPRRILVVGLGGGSDVFAAYAISRQLQRSHPKATILYANTKSNYKSDSEHLRGWSQKRDCLWEAPSQVVPLTCDRHGTALERSCPRGPEGSPLLFVLPAKGCVRLSQQQIGVVADTLRSLKLDLVVGVDLGGDSVSGGKEGRQDSEAGRDRQMLNCIRASGLACPHIVLGPGCDGETSEPEMRACCARLARAGFLMGVFSAEPLFEDMVTRCNTKVLSPTRTPNLMWRARMGELPAVKGTDEVRFARQGTEVQLPREWLLHGLVISYGESPVQLGRKCEESEEKAKGPGKGRQRKGVPKASRPALNRAGACLPTAEASELYTKPSVFITGGDVGADSIPLTVHEKLDVRLDGFMPKGFMRSDGNGAQIAARHGLQEGEGGQSWSDRKNVDLADAVLAFLTTMPETGRGTMQTCAYAASGKHKHVQIEKPSDSDFAVLKPKKESGKPVLVFWDVADSKVDVHASILRQFLREHRPRALMFSGVVEETLPGVERVGAQILRNALEVALWEETPASSGAPRAEEVAPRAAPLEAAPPVESGALS